MAKREIRAYKYQLLSFHRWRYFHLPCHDQWVELVTKQLGGCSPLPEVKRVFVVPPRTQYMCCKKFFAEGETPHTPSTPVPPISSHLRL